MARYCIGRNGIVSNVVEAPDAATALGDENADVFLDPTGSTNVGATYDVKDPRLDRMDQIALTLLFRIHNRVRVLEGQPQHTAAQFRTFIKTLI